MRPSNPTSRREFLARGASALAAPAVLSSAALGAGAGKTPASERIALGFIGMGVMCRSHLEHFLGKDDVQVVAVCDVDTTRREKARTTADESYSKKAKGSYKGCAGFNDFRELLARPDIDAVVIATPDHWHAIPVIEACKAGKDVYCEKPLTVSLLEAKTVVDAVRKHQRVFQTGSQQRTEFDGKFRTACEYVRNGRIGEVLTIHVGVGEPARPCDLPGESPEPGLDWDLWLGPAPMRPYNHELSPRGVHKHFPAWRKYREYGGGGLSDMGAHHFDIAQWALDRDHSGPVEVAPPHDETATIGARFRYDDGVEMVHGGPSGATFVGTKGIIYVDRGKLESIPDNILKKPLGDGDARLPRAEGHRTNWVECMRSRATPIASVEAGAHSAAVCILANLVYWHRRPLKWDPKTWQFPGDAQANAWLDRDRRDTWPLPTV
jgi:predicted dehydrogenase